VRLGGGAESLVQYAELGQAGMGSIQIDDPTATVGHAGDAIVGLKQFYIVELDETAGDQRLFTGYVADRRYSRGRDSHRTGAARLIDVSLVDENSFLSFRVFQPVALDATSSFDRPAETDTQRVAALLAVDFLSTTLFDEGFIEPAGVNMDANDYTGQRPVDVLNDCAQQSGLNFFVRFKEDTTHYVLHYRSNDSELDPAAASISNVLADEAADVFFANQDWELVKDPSRVVAGVLLPFKAGTVYENDLDTSYAFGYRDAYYPSTDVGTAAQATARALRYLDEGSSEDERLTGSCLVASSAINAIKQGQWLQVKFSHLPGYEAWRDCRVLRRDISQQEETSAWYTVRYELTPMTPSVASVAQLMRPNDNELIDGPSHLMRCNWDHDGDNPQGGDTGVPLVGLVSYYPDPKPGNGWTAIQCDGSGIVDLHFAATCIQVVAGDITWRFTIRKNGTVMATYDDASGGGLRVSTSGCDLTASAVTVANGDLIYGYIQLIGNGVGWNPEGLFTIPNGVGNGTNELRVTGDLRP
jgi:hypothetical protein